MSALAKPAKWGRSPQPTLCSSAPSVQQVLTEQKQSTRTPRKHANLARWVFTPTRRDRPSVRLVPRARSKTRRGPPHVSTQVCLSTWSCATTRISFPRAQKTSTRRRRRSLEMEQIALRINVRVVDCHSQKRSHCVLVWCLVPCLLPGAYGPAAVTRIRAAHSAAVTTCASALALFSLAAHRTATAQSPPPGRWASSSRAW